MSEPGITSTSEVRVRRAPKYPAFIIVGGGIGAIVTFVVTNLYPADPNVGFWSLLGYFSLFGITAGVVLGAVLAVILDRVGSRRARVAQAEHTTVEANAVEGDLED